MQVKYTLGLRPALSISAKLMTKGKWINAKFFSLIKALKTLVWHLLREPMKEISSLKK